ncbi:deoxynucleoside monophosphate kinase [uncultured Caudovirales phage]|uniref:Deoxynucleoside monophosphate kinase n=1 Tax=uncultured Caudovirales phage TaxID=2100421 RepID=A0A6J5KXE3_9CAUD|nr:deoxynucleoside monophosphate kinase [uncultured Caudovirales phage]
MRSPILIGVVGEAGSGKSTVASLLLETMENTQKIAFADQIKAFCAHVFDFSFDQLYGPSAMRNAPDRRYSFALAKKEFWANEELPLFDRIIAKLMCTTPTLEDLLDNRDLCKTRYSQFADEWLSGLALDDFPKTVARQMLDAVFAEIMSEKRELTPRYALQLLGTEFGRAIHPDIWMNSALDEARLLMEDGFNVLIDDVRFWNEASGISISGGIVLQVVRPNQDVAVETSIFKHASEQDSKSEQMKKYVHHVIVNDGSLEDLEKAVKRFLNDWWDRTPETIY